MVCKVVQPLGKKVWQFLKELNIELPYDLEISVLGTLKRTESLYKNLYVTIHATIIHNRSKVETTQISVNCERISKVWYATTVSQDVNNRGSWR